MSVLRPDVEADGMRKRSVVATDPRQGRRSTIQMNDLGHADRALAEQFGYNPVFKREFGWLSAFSFAVSISGLFATVATTFVYPLDAGGASSAIWCWLISGAGCMCIAASVAELVSAYPTSGGLYYTISRLIAPQWVPSVSWTVGWLNLLGQVAGIASSEYGSAQLLLAAVSMASGQITMPDGTITFHYVATVRQIIGVMAALTIVCGLINSLSTYWMEKVTKGYVIFHILVLVSCAIALLAKTPEKYRHNAKYAFTTVDGDSGWQPAGWAWLFGFLSVSWTMTDYDATAHIAEEIDQPEKKAAWAIFLAMLFTYVLGFLFNIVLVFVMGTTDQIDTTLEQPVAQIFLNSLGPAGGVFYTVCAFIILQFVCFTATQALGRTFFAFSRDRLVPFSKVWTKVNRFTGIPLYAVWLSIILCILINLIGLGSYTAISGVFNVTAIALDWSYCIPIFCKIFSKKFTPGPFNMGKLGYFVNAWACIWTLFVTIIFLMPTARPVAADTMNYAIAFLGGILLFAAIYWYAGGRKFYTGPLIEAQVVDDEEPSSGDASDNDIKHEKKYEK
ncbi:MAG: hypothetical protein M1828_006260 [Chrysothrix sp. TS-e1954]|nr:MAG: hypothetical protein M1828_006260 [Chrysothrix sp. TS-e1954]